MKHKQPSWDDVYAQLDTLNDWDAEMMEDYIELLTRLPIDDQLVLTKFMEAMVKVFREMRDQLDEKTH